MEPSLCQLYRSKQAGFSALGIAAVVTVLASISGIGFVVFKKSPSTETKTAATTNAAAPDAKDPVDEPQEKPQEPATTNIDIKELGIKVVVPNSINDLTYTASEVTLPNGELAKRAFFPLKA